MVQHPEDCHLKTRRHENLKSRQTLPPLAAVYLNDFKKSHFFNYQITQSPKIILRVDDGGTLAYFTEMKISLTRITSLSVCVCVSLCVPLPE
jgi:hypothetical protein